MSRYEVRPRGVYDNLAARVITRNDETWHTEYLPWLAAGNIPDPLPAQPGAPDPSPAEIAASERLVDIDDMALQVKANAYVRALVTRKPADVDDWINTNVTDLASAKVVLRVLAYVVALLARERLGL